MGFLDFLKIDNFNLVRTGFKEKYNQAIDKFFYSVEKIGNKLIFKTNIDQTELTLTTLDDLTGNKDIGDVVSWNGTTWYAATRPVIDLDPISGSNFYVSNKFIDEYSNEVIYLFKPTITNSSSSFLNINSLGDIEIRKNDQGIPSSLLANDLQSNIVYALIYDNETSKFQIISGGASEDNDYSSTVFISDGDNYNTSISKLDEILALLAPAKPGNLSTKTFAVVANPSGNVYTARQTANGNLRTGIVTDDLTPRIQFNPATATPASTNNGAYNADAGTLTSNLLTSSTNYTTSPITFTTGDETGASDSTTKTTLTITNDFDYHFGVAGRSGFWKAFLARLDVLSNLDIYPNEEHIVSMTHSLTGSTSLTFYTDDPITPSVAISGGSNGISTNALGNRYISGVPSLNTGDTINIAFTNINAIRTFYNSTRIASATSSNTTSATDVLTGIQTYGATKYSSLNLTTLTNRYSENMLFTMNSFNSRYDATLSGIDTASSSGDISTTQPGKTMRIDTVSNESARRTSGSGIYPTTGYGSNFDSTQSLVLNEELQMLNGFYLYPRDNYTNNYPIAGPNYNGLTGFRYVTFQLSVSGIKSVSVTINNFTSGGFTNPNFTLDPTKWSLTARVDGALPTVGWVNGNSPYSGVGNPTNNGDSAMVVGSSSSNVKVITFGTAVKTGTLYVRIGIDSTATDIQFSGINITAS